MTNFFASCELLCEECGEVSVTNLKPMFPGEESTRDLAAKKSTTYFSPRIFRFHYLELLGALLRKVGKMHRKYTKNPINCAFLMRICPTLRELLCFPIL